MRTILLSVLLLLIACNKDMSVNCKECKVYIPTYDDNSTKLFKVKN